MDFRLLGSVTAHVGTDLVRLGEPQHRLFLAVLLLADSRPVSKEALIDRLWGQEPPMTAQTLLRNIATKVRTFLEAGESGAGSLLPPGEGGYRIRVDRQRVDLWRFRERYSLATRLARSRPAEALRTIHAGLDEWSAAPISSAEPEPLFRLQGDWIAGVRRDLQQEYRRALAECARLELDVGAHGQAIARLEALSKLDPCDEDVAELLILAYCRVGRTADALQVLEEVTRQLGDELGTRPGPALVKLRERIAIGDPALRRSATDHPTAKNEASVRDPQQTPPDKAAKTLARSAAQLVVSAARDGSPDYAGTRGGELVQLLRKEFDGDDHATTTLTRVLSTPGDVDAVRQLRQVLVVCLRNDQSFQQDVERLVADRTTPVKGGVFYGDVTNAAVYNEKVVIKGGFRMGGLSDDRTT